MSCPEYGCKVGKPGEGLCFSWFPHSGGFGILSLRPLTKGLAGAIVMPNFIFRANIDHCLSLLDDPHLPDAKRAAIIKLLIEEQDKLAHYQEQLDFAESRAANGRDRIERQRRSLDGIDPSDANRQEAERLLASFEEIQKLLEDFCHRLRAKVVQSRL